MNTSPTLSNPRTAVGRRAHHSSFWLDRLPAVEPAPPFQGASRCDIAIIGGGLTGLSTAYHARQLIPGAEVRVLEALNCAEGATGRSGGFVTSLFGLNKPATALRFGRRRAIEAHRYMEDAVDFVERMVREQQIDCGFERTGTLHVATTAAQARRIEAELDLARAWGLESVEARDGSALSAQFPGGGFVCGAFHARNALLDPARFARGLYDLATRTAGVVIHEDSPVVCVAETQTGFHIRTAQGELDAERVVFATNAFTGDFEGLDAKQAPVLSHIVVTEPLSERQLQSIGWSSRCGLEDARTLMHYCRLTPDNRILLGGGDISPVLETARRRAADRAVFAHLERRLRGLFPQLEGIRLTHRWCGRVSLAADMAPVIGTLGQKKRALFAAGLMGHGVSMAPYNGLCLAELLAGRESERTQAFFVGRHALPWPPRAIRLPMLKAARAVMKLEDRFRWD